MSTIWQNIQFFAAFAQDSITISIRVLYSFLFNIIYYAIGNDPKSNLTRPSLASLNLEGNGRHPTTASARLEKYQYIPPSVTDLRSPCPALNLMANHGFIPRNGRELNGTVLTHGLMECYNLSWPLAAFLSWGGVLLLGQVGLFTLHDLSRHNRIEHDASIAHDNTPTHTPPPSLIYRHLSSRISLSDTDKATQGGSSNSSSGSSLSRSSSGHSSNTTSFTSNDDSPQGEEQNKALHLLKEAEAVLDSIDTEYAPSNIDPVLLSSFLKDARNGYFTARDIARARVRREREQPATSPLTAVQQEIARGEVALVLQIFSDAMPDGAGGGLFSTPPDRYAVSVDKFVSFLKRERLPEGWVPVRKTTLLGTVGVSSAIRKAMFEMRSKEASAAAALAGEVKGKMN